MPPFVTCPNLVYHIQRQLKIFRRLRKVQQNAKIAKPGEDEPDLTLEKNLDPAVKKKKDQKPDPDKNPTKIPGTVTLLLKLLIFSSVDKPFCMSKKS